MIAVFGGTFDPPHLGHSEAIQGVFEDPGCERLWILPSGRPVGKSPTLSPQQRLELSRLAFGAHKTASPVEILDLEVRWSELHPGEISTTWKILPELERKAQGEPLAWVIGTDQLMGLERWDQFPEVLGRIHWIVLQRAGHSDEKATAQLLAGWMASGLIRSDPVLRGRQGQAGYRVYRGGRSMTSLRLAPTRARPLSSTQIREHFARHREAPEGSLAPSVEAYLKLHGHYGSA